MKRKALAMILALCMVFALLPAAAFAAQPRQALVPSGSPELMALPEPPAETNGAYTITKTATGPGVVQSNPADSADAGDEVLVMANPNPGYLALVDDHGLDLEFMYIGFDMYVFTMPARNVTLDFYFEPVEGTSHAVKVNAPDECNWSMMNGVTSAKPGESVYLFVQEEEGYSFDPETGVTANCEELYYLGALDDEGEQHVYELWMPDHDVTFNIEITPVSKTYDVDMAVINRSLGYWGVESDNPAKPGDTVTIYAQPVLGCRVDEIYVQGGPEIRSIGNHRYTFTMPARNVLVYVTFAENINSVSATVETGLGGTARTSVSQAREYDTVKLICEPQEGYRVAKITGVDGLTDNGDNTYSFTMPNRAVNLKVLFLRSENPFLDINETQFFYDSVLWAVKEGITNGMTLDTFGPFAVCNRAQVITFLWRSAGSPAPSTTENPFGDVPAGSFYEDAVLWAIEKGITNGISANSFGPNMTCNRAQVVTFLFRSRNADAPEGVKNVFEDVPADIWYEAPVLWALANGITNGTDATHFNPDGQCQRAQVVTFLYRSKDIPTVYDLSWSINGQENTPSEFGTLELSHTKAAAGETVTATVVPAEGYVIEWVSCVGGTPVTQVSDTEYTFVMPGHAEGFHVNFVEAPAEPEPVKTYTLDVHTNVNAEITYVDGKTAAAPGESIFFYVKPEAGYELSGVSIFDPYDEIDLSRIKLYVLGDDLYEFVMIDHDIILNFNFA